MDLTDLIMTGVFIVVTAGSVLVVKALTGWAFWVSSLVGAPLGWILVMLAVWLFSKFTK